MADQDFTDETALITALRARRHDAFQVAVARYSAAMRATARAIVGSTTADDVVQDAWLVVFERIDAFEQRASFATWLQRIVANRAISYLRSRAREPSTPAANDDAFAAGRFDAAGSWSVPPLAWDADSPEALLAAEALQECIDKHLLEMSDNQRSVLVLRDMQAMPFNEICNELNLTASNVRVLLHRARMRLMQMVNHFEETGSC